jgi:EAL domain-containing protein (putative c-di-GMP-specific phosphodiesterase class I)
MSESAGATLATAATNDALRQTEREVRAALEREEFELWLQPLADWTGDVFAYEALPRWRHPSQGMIAADAIMPDGDAGLSADLDVWTLRACCREAARWRGELRVAANISAETLADEAFVPRLRALLDECGLPPRRLELEVIEDALVANPSAAGASLRRLKSLGVGLALDDFGAGRSCLAELQDLPFDRLKIDRSFVARLKRRGRTEGILRALIALGRALEFSVLATGVETRAQLALLRELRCGQFQGPLIGPPRPLAECVITPLA